MLGTSIGEVQSYHLTEPSEFLSRKHSVLFCACQLDTVCNTVTLLIRLCIKEEKTTGKRKNWNKSSTVEHNLDSRSLVLNWMRFFFSSVSESIAFHLGKSIGFALLLLCSLSISCLVLWPQLLFRSLNRTDLYVQILPALHILNLLVC